MLWLQVRAAAAGDVLQAGSSGSSPLDIDAVLGPAALYTGEAASLILASSLNHSWPPLAPRPLCRLCGICRSAVTIFVCDHIQSLSCFQAQQAPQPPTPSLCNLFSNMIGRKVGS